jgi:glycosyltransferase involved in cell wall biosynthesis
MTSVRTWVTVCVPVFRAKRYLRQSVISLLNQTYQWLRVFVINDGDPDLPWSVLADIRDPRLLRFNLATNRGPYFAHAIALEATHDSLLLIQDADDVSVPHRLESLLCLMRRDASTFAFSTLGQFHDDRGQRLVLDPPLYSTAPSIPPGPELKPRIPHHGLFDVRALKDLGGYFGGFEFGYDELLTNLILLTGSVSWTPEPLYWRRLRQDSLTRSPHTGMRSARRSELRKAMQGIYRLAYHDYSEYVARRISRDGLLRSIRARAAARRSGADGALIQELAGRLREAMVMQSRFIEDGSRPQLKAYFRPT